MGSEVLALVTILMGFLCPQRNSRFEQGDQKRSNNPVIAELDETNRKF